MTAEEIFKLTGEHPPHDAPLSDTWGIINWARQQAPHVWQACPDARPVMLREGATLRCLAHYWTRSPPSGKEVLAALERWREYAIWLGERLQCFPVRN